MAYPINRKLVVGVSSTALFNLEKESYIFNDKGLEAYRQYQVEKKAFRWRRALPTHL